MIINTVNADVWQIFQPIKIHENKYKQYSCMPGGIGRVDD